MRADDFQDIDDLKGRFCQDIGDPTGRHPLLIASLSHFELFLLLYRNYLSVTSHLYTLRYNVTI